MLMLNVIIVDLVRNVHKICEDQKRNKKLKIEEALTVALIPCESSVQLNKNYDKTK